MRLRLLAAALALGIGAVVVILLTRGTPSDYTPQAGDVNCGMVSLQGLTVYLVTGPADAESCFASASAHCRAAALTVVNQGVDTGTADVLEVDPHTGCAVVDHVSTYGIHAGSPTSRTCGTAVFVPAAGLTVHSCGADDITIANPVNLPTYPAGHTAPPAGAGVKGMVVGVECYPRAGATSAGCTDHPSRSHVVVRDANGALVAEQTTGLDGSFALSLLPGTYQLAHPYSCYGAPLTACPAPPVTSRSMTFTVAPRRWTSLRVEVSAYHSRGLSSR